MSLPAVPRRIVHWLGHPGFDQAGANRVDPDARAAELLRRAVYKADDAGLGRRISRSARAAAKAGDAGGADDRPTAAIGDQRSRIFNRKEGPDQVNPQDLGPIG